MVASERDGATFHGSGLWRGVGWFRRTPDSGGSTGRPEVIEQELEAPASTAVGRSGKVYLIGFMGAGKTSVGSRLADLMGMEFVDLDQVVEAEENLPISRIFAEQGEEGFRRLESAALGSLAERRDRLVIATGGGTATLPANVEFMRSSGTIFWLDPSFEAIVSRLGTAGRQRRPLFASPTQARALYEERRDRYSAAGLRVAIGADEQPDEVAERIVLLLQANPAGRSQADQR